MLNKLYTLGYSTCRDATELLDISQQRGDALILDIRLKPYSRIPGFNQPELARLLGRDRYQHCGLLGNRNYQGGEIQIAQPQVGLTRLLQLLSQRPVVLLCGCGWHEQCHRTTVAHMVLAHEAGRDLSVFHLLGNKVGAAAGNAGGKTVTSQIPILTLWQPFASWVVPQSCEAFAGLVEFAKDIENRDWSSDYRGLVVIHASVKADPDFIERRKGRADQMTQACADWLRDRGLDQWVEPTRAAVAQGLPYGGIIGQVEMTGCVAQSESPWFVGDYGFCLQNPKALTFTPIRGQQKFWFASEVLRQLGVGS